MTKDRILAVLSLAVLCVSLVYAATQTSNLGLYKFDIGDIDYPANQNSNMDTLDAAILDKRVGGTISGDLDITGSLSFGSATTAKINGLDILGAKTSLELQGISCPTYCIAYNTDENAMYENYGTGAGEFRNIRTGTGPQ